MVCTLALGVGSEFLQGFLPNGRDFDFWDIVANLAGSLVALGLCSLYHKRMLERKRLRKTGGGGAYTEVPGAEDADVEDDIELGEGIIGAQESGVSGGGAAAGGGASPEGRKLTLEEEVDTWDENAPDDWDAPPEGANVHEEVRKQRAD